MKCLFISRLWEHVCSTVKIQAGWGGLGRVVTWRIHTSECCVKPSHHIPETQIRLVLFDTIYCTETDIKNKILYILLVVLEMLLTQYSCPGFIIRTFFFFLPQTIKKAEKNTIKLGV